MQVEDTVRVRHMIEAAESALAFAQGRARGDLDNDKMLQFALVRAVQVVGEAARVQQALPDLLAQLKSHPLPE